MKSTTICCWKYLLSKIHPPLPMTPQESRNLLIKFNSSFQRHLDRKHPEVMSGNRSRVPQHIQAVLDNPLIGGGRKPCNHFDGHVDSLSQLRRLIKRPMDHFKDEVAAGIATVESAKMCLIAQLQLARASDKPLPLRSAGLGPIVLNWMCSVPAMRVELSSLDLHLVVLLAAVLNAESNENMIWHWIKLLQQRLRNEPSESKRQWIFKAQPLVFQTFLRYEIMNSGVYSAVDVFVRGLVEISSLPEVSTNTVKRMVRRAGRFLMLQILNDTSLIPTSQLKSFIQTIHAWSPTPKIHQMLLELHHPQCTNISAALKFLAELDVDGIVGLENKIQRRDLVRLSLKVAELLLSSGSEQELRLVMEFLRTNFAAEVGCSDPDPSPPVRHKESHEEQQQSTEESSLLLLDSLAVH